MPRERRIPDKNTDRVGYQRYHYMRHMREDLLRQAEALRIFVSGETNPQRAEHFQKAYLHATNMLSAFEEGWKI